MVVTGQGIAKPGLKVNHTHTVLNAFLDGERGALQPSPLHSDPHLSPGQAELRTDTRGFIPSWGLGSFPDPGPLTLPSSGRADEAQGQCNSEGYQTARRFGGAKALTDPQGVRAAGGHHEPRRKQHQRRRDAGHLLKLLMEPLAGLGMT